VIDELVSRLREADRGSVQRALGSRIFGEAADALKAMKEALERARPHVVNASLGVVPKESEACAMDDLRMIDATLNQGGGQ
jgi:hypothetical protein